MLCGVRQANALQRRRSGGENTARLGLISVFEHTDGLKLSKYFTRKTAHGNEAKIGEKWPFWGLREPMGSLP